MINEDNNRASKGAAASRRPRRGTSCTAPSSHHSVNDKENKNAAAETHPLKASPLVERRVQTTKPGSSKSNWESYTAAGACIGLAVLLVGSGIYINTLRITEENRILAAERQADKQQKEENEPSFGDFNKVQERLGNADAKIRAHAVLPLARLSIEPAPDAPIGDDGTPKLSDANYPHLSEGASRIVQLLSTEKNAQFRVALLKGLVVITDFIKIKNANHRPNDRQSATFLSRIVNSLADGNRDAKNDFIETLADYNAVVARPDLRTLAAVTRFVPSRPDFTMICLHNLVEDKAFTPQKRDVLVRRDKVPIEELLDRVRIAAARLCDIRDAIVACLRPAGVSDTMMVEPIRFFQPLNLKDCFLAGANAQICNFNKANLSGSHLEGANFGSASLEQAQLDGCYLEAARLTGANVSGAHGGKAIFTRANLQSAMLYGASFPDSHFEAANLNNADAGGTNLSGSNFTGASLYWARLDGTNFSRAVLNGTKLGGIWHGTYKTGTAAPRWLMTDFDKANWKDADLSYPTNVNFVPTMSRSGVYEEGTSPIHGRAADAAQTSDDFSYMRAREPSEKLRAWLQGNFPY